MHKMHRKTEQGFSLIVSLLALMLLSAVAIGMMFMASTETTVSSNFKSEETAYFAARAGVEEVRDRMLPPPASPTGNFTNWLGQTTTYSINGLLPACMPGFCSAGNPWALYILNGKNPKTGANMAMPDVTNIGDPTNIVADDELCHDFPGVAGTGVAGMTPVAANIRCSGTHGLPGGTSWYASTTSIAPLPVDFKWVRVTLKANNTYPLVVDASQPAGNQVCWSGSGTGANQVVVAAGQHCADLNASPVYLVTALAVSPSGGSNGAKRIVQLEVGQTYIPSNLPAGLFAVGTGCSALSIAGNAQTGSFNSATEGAATNPPSNLTNSGGDVGSNGNIFVGGSSSNVNGDIHTNDPTSIGACPGNGVTVSGGPGMGSILSTVPYNPPIPPMPNPLPPTTSKTYNGTTLTAAGGPYGNVTIKGTVTLTGGPDASHPAVYTFNSLSENGNATLAITGPVIINLAGVGVGTVLDLTGNGFSNSTNIPSNFVINYGGSDAMRLSGGSDAYGIINAPNSAIEFRGGSNFYGQAVGLTIDDQGGTNFYWDTSLSVPPPVNTSAYHEIAMRELSY
jgi:PilX N-terminal